MTPDLLTITELAARWRIPERAAKEIVRTGQVPFVCLSAGRRLVWARVRFDLDVVRAWERDGRKAYEPPVSRPELARATPVSRLGKWRA